LQAQGGVRGNRGRVGGDGLRLNNVGRTCGEEREEKVEWHEKPKTDRRRTEGVVEGGA